MKKILTIFSKIVIYLLVLSLFGWMVNQISNKEKEFGFITEPIKFMYTFPDLFSQSVEEVKTLPKTFIPTPKNFKPINNLKEDVYTLTAHSDVEDTRSIVIRNLKNDSVLHKWNVENTNNETARVFHPLYLSDGSLVYYYSYKWYGMKRIDSSGKEIWKQKKFIFHHGMELNKDGDIWACAKERAAYNTGLCKIENKSVFYEDNIITKLDIETGDVLFHKSVSEILKDNNFANYILKAQVIKDPIHLNDIQPALKTTDYYQEDDVFLSIRSISCIIHYRPSTNEVIKIIEGPFVNQHDVDFLNDHTLAIFNNNFYPGGFNGTKKPPKDSSKLVDMGHFYSSIVTYDLRNGDFSVIADSIFRTNKIFTRSEGLQEFIDPETFFIEEQNSGLLWIIRDDEVIYKNVFKSQHEGHHHLPNWTRIIKKI